MALRKSAVIGVRSNLHNGSDQFSASVERLAMSQ